VTRSAIDAFGADLRHAARVLSREPAFTLPAVALLGIAVGASAALFSVADQALLRPLPYAEADRIVAVRDARLADPSSLVPSAPGNFLDWARLCTSCDVLAAWQDGSGASTLRDAAGPLVVETVKVTPSFFGLLGAEARLGRVFDDTLRGAAFDVTDRFASGDRVLMMSYALWAGRFGRDPGVVGLTLSLDGVPWRVAGVLAEDFALPRPTSQLFLAWDVEASFRGFDGGPPRDLRFLNVLARLRRGVGRAAAESELQRLSEQLAREHPKANAGWSVRLVALRDELAGQARSALVLLGGALALVLLAGASNLTSLKLARSVAGARERAVRLSLGASRTRLVGQQLAECVVLAILGLAAALVVARLTLSLLATIAPSGLPGIAGARLDARVSMVAAALALGASLASSLLPLIAASRSPAAGALRAGSRTTTATRGMRRTWRLLVVGEVATALALLAAAGLLGRSFARVMAVDPGFHPQGLATLRVSLDHASYTYGEPSRAFYRQLLERVAALPGVTHAGAVTALPLSPVTTDFARPWWREGEADPGALAERTAIRMATPGYFEALGIPLRRGRTFTRADHERAPRVVLVNETLARRAFGDEPAVGRRLVLDYLGGAYSYEIVGVVGDVRFSGLRAAPRAELFIAHAQNPYLDLTLVVRGRGDEAELARRVEHEIRSLDPGQPAHALASMAALLRLSSAEDRFATTLLLALAGLAVTLAATGIHGLLAFVVAQRHRELGIRQALGATPRQVGVLVLAESGRLVAAGCALGALLAALLSPALASRLFETRASDPIGWGFAFVVVACVHAAASAPPAISAARTDPVKALRAE
jgi:putative ABC transport system permease protein